MGNKITRKLEMTLREKGFFFTKWIHFINKVNQIKQNLKPYNLEKEKKCDSRSHAIQQSPWITYMFNKGGHIIYPFNGCYPNS